MGGEISIEMHERDIKEKIKQRGEGKASKINQSRFRCGIDRIVALLGTDQIVLDRPLEHLHDPILAVPPPIGTHDADAIRDALERRALAASQVGDGDEPALARKVVLLRDGAPIDVALLLRRRTHRAQDPHHTVRGRPAERPRPLPWKRSCGRRVPRHDDVHHPRAVRLRERSGGQARWRLHTRLDAVVWFIEMCWVH